MSGDALIDAAEDYAIWSAMNPDKERDWVNRLAHWAKTSHIGCACDVRPDWGKGGPPYEGAEVRK